MDNNRRDRFAGKRKFTVAILCWAGATVAVIIGRLDGGGYVTTLGLILGLYGAANVFAKRNGENAVK